VKKAGLVLIGAVPGLALGYVVLTGILLGRVRPLPITFVPEPAAGAGEAVAQRAA